ncbi:22669_t:CDS:2 [Racocetra persica]|uniref:22669_t:CDS:1 n=1 Tax=Racocetra persica TaxID=160502 RepID=A0ACA9L4B7_9GLOM|nr:22669_t:CDS:2 [Racocetra persica]
MGAVELKFQGTFNKSDYLQEFSCGICQQYITEQDICQSNYRLYVSDYANEVTVEHLECPEGEGKKEIVARLQLNFKRLPGSNKRGAWRYSGNYEISPAYEKARIENGYIDTAEQLERQSKEYLKDIERAKRHEELGKEYCKCSYCELEKQLRNEVAAERKKIIDDYEKEQKKSGENEAKKVRADCGNCYENKKVDPETGLCEKSDLANSSAICSFFTDLLTTYTEKFAENKNIGNGRGEMGRCSSYSYPNRKIEISLNQIYLLNKFGHDRYFTSNPEISGNYSYLDISFDEMLATCCHEIAHYFQFVKHNKSSCESDLKLNNGEYHGELAREHEEWTGEIYWLIKSEYSEWERRWGGIG